MKFIFFQHKLWSAWEFLDKGGEVVRETQRVEGSIY